MVRQPDLFRTIKQSLVSHEAYCLNCEDRCSSRNAQGWATLHVKRNPGHVTEVKLGYVVKEQANDA